jgi:hypothetical protein
LKSIILNNLYGVDIMEEAVEICKLRLFLKLAAQVESVDEIEPLPDIDFNICAGNTLVGNTTREEIQRAMTITHKDQHKMLLFAEEQETVRRIEEKAGDVDRLFSLFRQQQIEYGGDVTPADKQQLRDRLQSPGDELSIYLAGEYGVIAQGEGPKAISLEYQRWLTSHKPFHWFVDVHGIMRDGGFDVIIGNPPYDALMKDLKQHSQRKEAFYKTTGQVIYDEFYPKHSKPIIDEIDRVLAQHYGFTDEELDFIINYDIKYRMGRDVVE